MAIFSPNESDVYIFMQIKREIHYAITSRMVYTSNTGLIFARPIEITIPEFR